MNQSAPRSIGTWAIFGMLMFVSLVSWSMGSPELALVLAIGAVGALCATIRQRLAFRHMVRSLSPTRRQHI
jgi:hypothetical protein